MQNIQSYNPAFKNIISIESIWSCHVGRLEVSFNISETLPWAVIKFCNRRSNELPIDGSLTAKRIPNIILIYVLMTTTEEKACELIVKFSYLTSCFSRSEAKECDRYICFRTSVMRACIFSVHSCDRIFCWKSRILHNASIADLQCFIECVNNIHCCYKSEVDNEMKSYCPEWLCFGFPKFRGDKSKCYHEKLP